MHPSAAVERLRELPDPCHRRLPEAGESEDPARRRALRAAAVVPGGGVGVLLAGVERHELVAIELQGHLLDLERAEIDPERVIGLAV